MLPHVAEVLGLMNEFVGFTLMMSMGMFNVLATVWTTLVLMPCQIVIKFFNLGIVVGLYKPMDSSS